MICCCDAAQMPKTRMRDREMKKNETELKKKKPVDLP